MTLHDQITALKALKANTKKNDPTYYVYQEVIESLHRLKDLER